MRSWPEVAAAPSATVQSFASSPSSKLLIDVQPTRYRNIEFEDNLFFNDLTGTIVEGEIIVIAGAGVNKSTKTRQLVLDRAIRGIRTLMILTEEPVERRERGSLRWLGPPALESAVGAVQHPRRDRHRRCDHAAQLLGTAGTQPARAVPRRGDDRARLDPGAGAVANDFEAYRALIQFFSLAQAARVLTFAVCHVTKRGGSPGRRRWNTPSIAPSSSAKPTTGGWSRY